MVIFIELKKHFAFLKIKPDGQSNFNIENLIIVFLFVFCFIAMGAFASFESKTLFDFVNSSYGSATAALNIFTYSSNVLKRTRIFKLISKIEDIIKERAHRAKIYEKVNVKIEKYTKIVYIALMQATMVTLFMSKVFTSYWLYNTTDLGSNAFIQTYPMSMPFNWKTPIGYAITMSFQFVSWIYLLTSCCCILSFLGGVCWLLIAFIEDIREDIHILNETKGNSAKIKTKLNKIIEFHSTAKQFVCDFSDIYEIIIIGYYLWSLSTICSSLFLVHIGTSKGNADPNELSFALIIVFWSFVQMFIFCNFGQNVSDQFSQVDDMIYDCNWYTFPDEVQRMLPIVMISAQQPATLNGFGNLSCTREAFKKVANGGFSYFMTIRKMY